MPLHPGRSGPLLGTHRAIAARVRTARKACRYTQAELASLMGHNVEGRTWNRQTVVDVENCSRQLIVDELVWLAFFLGVTLVDLLEPTEETPIPPWVWQEVMPK